MQTIIKGIIMLAIMVAPAGMQAQSINPFSGSVQAPDLMRAPYGQLNGLVSTTRTTDATASRLVSSGSNRLDGSDELTDSVIYNYSGQRGGGSYGLCMCNMDYDTATDLSYSMGAFQVHAKDIQLFDERGNVVTHISQWDLNSGSLLPATYKQQNTYDSMNRLIMTLAYNPDGVGGWRAEGRYAYAYNAAGKLATMVIAGWNTAMSAWEDNCKYTYSYDGEGKRLSETQQQINHTSLVWDNVSKNEYSYDAARNITDISSLSWYAGGWYADSKVMYRNFAGLNLPKEAISMQWNGSYFDSVSKYNYSYNSYGQLVVSYGQSAFWDGWISTPDDYETRYHYETFTTATSGVMKGGLNLSVYPVPAKDEVSIDMAWAEAEAFTLTVMDMQGRIMLRKDVKPCSIYAGKLLLAGLAEGNYILTIATASGKTARTISVLR